MVREMAKSKGLTVDELLNELIGGEWITCSLCEAKIKATNMSSQVPFK
jgi:hypothetical protein